MHRCILWFLFLFFFQSLFLLSWGGRRAAHPSSCRNILFGIATRERKQETTQANLNLLLRLSIVSSFLPLRLPQSSKLFRRCWLRRRNRRRRRRLLRRSGPALSGIATRGPTWAPQRRKRAGRRCSIRGIQASRSHPGTRQLFRLVAMLIVRHTYTNENYDTEFTISLTAKPTVASTNWRDNFTAHWWILEIMTTWNIVAWLLNGQLQSRNEHFLSEQ